MKKTNGGSFTSLDPYSGLFLELKNNPPHWWKLLLSDKDLYIEIRKDNYINVYFYGGSLARIKFGNGHFIVTTHQKYLGDNTSRGKDKRGHDIFRYIELDVDAICPEQISQIKDRIYQEYIKHIDTENCSEKWIQGEMIKNNRGYIDSEFQFNKDKIIGYLRIDLVELTNGKISFIELKRINDNRLRNDIVRNPKIPEIISQMGKYKMFINKYEVQVIDYYRKLISIKKSLGLLPEGLESISINKDPSLIIKNTYNKDTEGRRQRINAICKLLEENDIDFSIK